MPVGPPETIAGQPVVKRTTACSFPVVNVCIFTSSMLFESGSPRSINRTTLIGTRLPSPRPDSVVPVTH